ncbi:MAG: hypothetical protein H0T42_24500 [Deltaproteobacteria bacterium]|nr:hypothetical protein [Deltaproteobacteria bacterium]
MRARLFALMVILVSACGEDPPESFPTYQECFDSRTMDAAQLVPDAIVQCCLDHPIDGMTSACGTTTPDCINYLTVNLNQTSASQVEKMDACAAYVRARDMELPDA